MLPWYLKHFFCINGPSIIFEHSFFASNKELRNSQNTWEKIVNFSRFLKFYAKRKKYIKGINLNDFLLTIMSLFWFWELFRQFFCLYFFLSVPLSPSIFNFNDHLIRITNLSYLHEFFQFKNFKVSQDLELIVKDKKMTSNVPFLSIEIFGMWISFFRNLIRVLYIYIFQDKSWDYYFLIVLL
jgi:hypothetical protein